MMSLSLLTSQDSSLIIDLIYLSDCGTPTADTGYVVGLYSTTTYGSSATMRCATGYDGTAVDITCTAGGTWSSQTGCSIVGK